MAKILSDNEVEDEIARLEKSPLVKLAIQERRLRERRRLYLESLLQLEKTGKELKKAGITPDVLTLMYSSDLECDCYLD